MDRRRLRVQGPQVSRSKPPVGREDLGGPGRIPVVAPHDVGAPHLDLSLAARRRAGDADVHACKGRACAAGMRAKRGAAGDKGRGLGQAVPDRVGEAGLTQERLHVRRECRTADAEEAQLPAEEPLQPQAGQAVQDPARGGERVQAASPQLGQDLRAVDLLDDQWDRQHDRRPQGGENRREDGGGGRPVEVGDRGALHERCHEAEGALVGMGKRQDGEQPVGRSQLDDRPGGHGVGDDVAVGQHDALGVPRGAGGVDHGCQVLLAKGGPLEGSGHPCIARRPGSRGGAFLDAEVVEPHNEPPVPDPRDPVHEPRRCDDRPAIRVGDDHADLRRGEVGQDGNRHRCHRGDGEVGDAPGRVVLGQERDPVAAPDPVRGQKRGKRARPRLEVTVGNGGGTDHGQRRAACRVLRALQEHALERLGFQCIHGVPNILADGRGWKGHRRVHRRAMPPQP